MGLTRLEDTCIRPKPDFEQFRKAVMRDGKPDYVPFYELFANGEIIEEVLDRKIQSRADVVEFYHRAGYDYVPTWVWVNLPGGSLIDRTTGYPIRDWATFESYPWPEVSTISFGEFEVSAPMLPEGMKMVGQTGGIFETAEKLVGYEQLCYMLIDDPSLVAAIFEKLDVLYQAMYKGMAEIDGVGALVISDDLGFKTQTMIAPDELRKYVFPSHKKLARIAHAKGKACLLHCCGNLTEVMDDILDYVGIDAKHSYEDGILPVTEAKKLYGHRMGILGGFDVHRLCISTEQEVRAYTRMLIETCGSDGGYCLGSGNSIAKFVPVRNYLAMLDEGWRARR
jgi:uroporphyrinogen decarboxylase